MPLVDGNMQIRCALTGSAIPGGGVNVWHMQKTGGAANLTEAQAVVDALRDFYTAINDRIPTTQTVIVGSQVLDLSTTPATLVPVIPRSVTGLDPSAGLLPAQTTLTVKLRTNVVSRSGRGRIYLGPFTENQNDAGAPNTALMTDVNAAIAAHLTPLAQPFDNVRGLAVYSRLLDDFIPVTSVTAATTWSVLRSRR